MRSSPLASLHVLQLLSLTRQTTVRAELIGHYQPCMTEIYLHIDARMADYIHTHPYTGAWQDTLKGRRIVGLGVVGWLHAQFLCAAAWQPAWDAGGRLSGNSSEHMQHHGM